MPNVNTMTYQQAGPNQNNIAPLTNAAGTTETAFSLRSNAFSGLGGGVIPLQIPATSVSIASWSNQVGSVFDSARPFRIRAYGTVTTGASCNITVKLYQVPSAILSAGTAGTLANDSSMASSGTFAVNTTSANWEMTAECIWDSVSQRLTGTFYFNVNGALVALAALTTITALSSDRELNFLVSGTFSASNAANTHQLQYFEIEQV